MAYPRLLRWGCDSGITRFCTRFAYVKKLKVKHAEARGLAIGAISHALGTVTCMESDQKAGSYSSIALVLCGIMTSILAPITFKILYFFMA